MECNIFVHLTYHDQIETSIGYEPILRFIELTTNSKLRFKWFKSFSVLKLIHWAYFIKIYHVILSALAHTTASYQHNNTQKLDFKILEYFSPHKNWISCLSSYINDENGLLSWSKIRRSFYTSTGSNTLTFKINFRKMSEGLFNFNISSNIMIYQYARIGAIYKRDSITPATYTTKDSKTTGSDPQNTALIRSWRKNINRHTNDGF